MRLPVSARLQKSCVIPSLASWKKVHNKIVSEICAGTKWRVEPVGSFETGEVMIQTRFKSREMMEKAMADLESIAKFSAGKSC